MTKTIAQGYQDTQERIRAACEEAGRDPQDVSLMVVTKFHPVETVAELVRLGVRNFGENREQEARQKAQQLLELDAEEGVLQGKAAEWSMIGQLQSNKCNAVSRWAHSVHSVDSQKLVRRLGNGVRRALDEGSRTDSKLGIFLQVSIDDDIARGGTSEDEVFRLADQTSDDPNLQLRGLMSVPPLDSDPDKCFGYLQQLSQQLQENHPEANEISAGMTSDLEAAIRHGSTCVRVGTAILGPRPQQH
ncbi:MAG TPA: YggS family pyridoxal phosphate-dependent enzyme [Corynebacteriales bacterium]|nr:YggS family pyridoxal phosphate-dependent enzyme [Mycobacteriales bacterium]